MKQAPTVNTLIEKRANRRIMFFPRSPTDLALSCAARLLRLDWNSSVRRQAAGAVVGGAHRTAVIGRSSGRVSCSALLGRGEV